MTPTEINEAVAKKLDSMKPNEHVGEAIVLRGGAISLPFKPYSTDISAAWEMVEKMRQDDYSISIHTIDNGEWCVQFVDDVMKSWEDVTADTAPMAICLAFLKLP